MKVSYHWLQTYFDTDIPKPADLVDVLTMHAFEIEDVTETENDTLIDVDILPNRAHDCLSHRGIAREIALLTGNTLVPPERSYTGETIEADIAVSVADSALCPRYMARTLTGVSVGASPEWLKKTLEGLGERSINNIVDLTNFVLFDTGQPLHAFDADKVDGNMIYVRPAEEGETITLLDGAEATFQGGELVIADEKEPLAIAGVKGGTKAEVDESTTRVILESANFDATHVRKTARTHNINTDASKRFENEITPELVRVAMEELTALIAQLSGNESVEVSEVVDAYPRKPRARRVGVSVSETNATLGTQLTEQDIIDICSRLSFAPIVVAEPASQVIEEAEAYLDAPYEHGASVTYDAPEKFDCSSFVAFCYAQAGIGVPRISVDQYAFGEAIAQDELAPGDILFFNSGTGKVHYETKEFLPGTEVSEGIDHCALYAGNGHIIHASWSNGVVVKESLSESDLTDALVGCRRMPQSAESRIVTTIPHERIDVRRDVDLIEEIGRVRGYANLESNVPAQTERSEIDAQFYYAQLIRTHLCENGFSELYLYSFTETGKRKILNPLSPDKKALRTQLAPQVADALTINLRNSDLLGTDTVSVFEIGHVFAKEEEYMACAIAVACKKAAGGKKHARTILDDTVSHLETTLGAKTEGTITEHESGAIYEFNLDKAVENLGEPADYDKVLSTSEVVSHYVTPSPYPFVVRDIAVWVPQSTRVEDVSAFIQTHAGDLLAREPRLFDAYEKDEHISYAFRLVFQSYEKTLTDEEVNGYMDAVYGAVEAQKGWEVR